MSIVTDVSHKIQLRIYFIKFISQTLEYYLLLCIVIIYPRITIINQLITITIHFTIKVTN